MVGVMKNRRGHRATVEALSESKKVELILELQTRVAELEARLGMNSGNSSKPPSSDGYAKPNPKSLREPSGLKPGGQKGHGGSTLRQVSDPDTVVVHAPRHCPCGCSLDGAAAVRVERRQIIELPRKLAEVTEYQIVTCTCPQCGRMVRADAPPETSAPVQYGPRLRALSVYLRDYQLLPYGRLTQLFRDVLGVGMCKRTVETAGMQAYGALEPFEQALRAQLLDAPVLHADETGMRAQKKLQWIHSLSTPALTLYQAHPKRGGEAIEANGIIPAFKGTLVHDCWKPYFQYGGGHALCGAHLLRELLGVNENEGHRWAQEMAALLEMIAKTVGGRGASPLSTEAVDWFGGVYDDILARARPELPPPEKTPGKRGRAKNAKSTNLHGRLQMHRDAVLLCLRDPQVPFTNNRAEQDIRMVKLRQKISGCTRTFEGVQRFARIRGYVSTSLKQGKDLLDNIVKAITGRPWIPQPSTSQS
jgi:transposase